MKSSLLAVLVLLWPCGARASSDIAEAFQGMSDAVPALPPCSDQRFAELSKASYDLTIAERRPDGVATKRVLGFAGCQTNGAESIWSYRSAQGDYRVTIRMNMTDLAERDTACQAASAKQPRGSCRLIMVYLGLDRLDKQGAAMPIFEMAGSVLEPHQRFPVNVESFIGKKPREWGVDGPGKAEHPGDPMPSGPWTFILVSARP